MPLSSSTCCPPRRLRQRARPLRGPQGLGAPTQTFHAEHPDQNSCRRGVATGLMIELCQEVGRKAPTLYDLNEGRIMRRIYPNLDCMVQVSV